MGEFTLGLYGRRFLQIKRPNQQYQSTEGTVVCLAMHYENILLYVAKQNFKISTSEYLRSKYGGLNFRVHVKLFYRIVSYRIIKNLLHPSAPPSRRFIAVYRQVNR